MIEELWRQRCAETAFALGYLHEALCHKAGAFTCREAEVLANLYRTFGSGDGDEMAERLMTLHVQGWDKGRPHAHNRIEQDADVAPTRQRGGTID